MKRKILKFFFVILCMSIIFLFSMENGEQSSEKSDSVIVTFSESILGRKLTSFEKKQYIEKYVILVRKSAHFFVYFLLGLSIISLLSEYRILDRKTILISVFLVFLYACSDEVHQMFVPGRTGMVMDVFLDTVGGFLSTIGYYYLSKRRRKSHE